MATAELPTSDECEIWVKKIKAAVMSALEDEQTDQAMALEPGTPGPLLMGSFSRIIRTLYGWAVENDALDEAIAITQRLIDADPGNGIGFGLRGLALMASGEFADGVADCQRGVTLTPNITSTRTMFARTLNAVGRFGGAARGNSSD